MPLACCLGQGHPKDLANDEHTINNNQMQTKTVFGEVTRQTLPTTACPGHAVFGRVCSSSLRTTNIHTKTKSQHFYAVGMGTEPAMKFRRVQANKGMQPKRAKGQHWATKGGGWSEAKSPAFCNERHYGKESPDSISKASTHACGVGIYFYFIRPSIISFDGHRILICTLRP